ncbi:unnamed protein product [Symbiodinium natans]|uniref:Ricin B lectin domain-containing protein n=1 Tax=Symbiodinium natans TaxID=878477 RepID=A0A812J614_9DINO|nr:unnamed protein product [Symbiodinium natans]
MRDCRDTLDQKFVWAADDALKVRSDMDKCMDQASDYTVYMGTCHHLNNQRFEFDLPRYAGRTIGLPAASLDSVWCWFGVGLVLVWCWFSAYRITVMTSLAVTVLES